MQIENEIVKFIGSYSDVSQLPISNLPEYCFIGRSNVGKSSLLNFLTKNAGLAKISKKPGKTQAINLFEKAGNFNFVDLPGYGFAERSKSMRESWQKMTRKYLIERQNLALCFILVDSRIPFQQIDREFINWTGENEIPISIVYTKTDGVNLNDFAEHQEQLSSELLKFWDELPQIFKVSSVKKIGDDEIWQYITHINNTISKMQ